MIINDLDYSFVTKIIILEALKMFLYLCDVMENVTRQIEKKIKNQRSGSFIFPEDFRGSGSATAIKTALSRLAVQGKVSRLARGIYYKPKNHPLFGELLPPAEQVAENIARRERIRIRPSGMYALHRLGLTTQVPTKLVYLTDGQRRKINFGKTEITFKPTTAKKMSYKGPISSLVIQALEEIGTQEISAEIKDDLKSYLLKENPELLKRDLTLASAQIHDYILKLLK